MRRAFLALLLATTALASGDPYPRIWNYRQTSSAGGLQMTGADARTATILGQASRDRSRWRINVMDVTPWYSGRGYQRTDAIDTMRAYQALLQVAPAYLNMPAMTLAYVVMQGWFHDHTYVPGADSTFFEDYDRNRLAYNGILYDVGTTNDHSLYNVNWASRAFSDSMSNLIVNTLTRSHGPEGVFFDYFNTTPKGSGEGVNTAFNFDLMGVRDGYSMDSAFAENIGRMVDRIHANGKLVFGNVGGVGGFTHSAKQDSFLALHPLDGELHEGFLASGTGCSSISYSFDSAMVFVRQSRPNYKLLKCENANGAPTAAVAKAAARYTLGVACMGDGWAWLGQGLQCGGRCSLGGSDGDTRCGYYDEYSVNVAQGIADTTGAHEGWLGLPNGPATLVPGTTQVYMRSFWHGIVVVNGSSSSVTVPLGTNYRAITGVVDPTTNNGVVAAAVTVPSKDARFLLPFPSNYPCPWPEICPIW